MSQHQKYMKIALALAKKAVKSGDIPVGALVVDKNGVILGKGYNQKEKTSNPINHAEIIAIVRACKKINSWRLEDCTIYSTLEPCLMCLATIVQARINYIVFGLESEKFGAIKVLEQLKLSKNFKHNISYFHENTLASKALLQSFFSKLREQNDMI